METDKQLTPARAIHPGEILREELQARAIKQRDLADKIGCTPSLLCEVIRGKRNIGEDLALKLEKALGISYSFWMKMQASYNYSIKMIDQRTAEERKAVSYEDSCSAIFNLKLIYKRLNLHTLSVVNRVSKLQELLSFDLREVEAQVCGLYKHSEKRTSDNKNMLSWIILNMIAIHKAKLPSGYQPGGALKVATEIAQMANANTLTPDELQKCLESHGIAYLHVPKLEKAPVDAYSTIINGTPVISVTYRCDDMDKLAFDVLHELCHIDRHLSDGQSFIAIHGCDYSNDPREKEANSFARDTLIPQEVWSSIIGQSAGSINREAILTRIAKQAKQQGISQTIAVARYKYESDWYKTSHYRSPKISDRV